MQIEIGKIEDGSWYIDKAFRRGKAKVNNTKIKAIKERVEKYKYLESIRINVIKDTLHSDISNILQKLPDPNDLDFFYKELFVCFVDMKQYAHARAGLSWAQKRIDTLGKDHIRKIAKETSTSKEILSVRNQFLARVSSVMNQIKDHFPSLDKARKQIKELPSLKTSLYTVAIAGFPNVGKSTLLSKITDSKPQIASYAFTTKGLMIGYMQITDTVYKKPKRIKHKGKKSIDDDETQEEEEKQKKTESNLRIQMIDTPGTLNRPEKMNKIERMAYLAMQYRADFIVYVFDFTEPYGIIKQMELYESIKKLNKPMAVYFSKSDIIKTSLIDSFSIKGTQDPQELRALIVKEFKKHHE